MDNLPELECSIQGCRLVELDIVICNIYRTRKRSLPRYQNTEKCVEKQGRRPSFFNNFEVF